MSMRTTGMPTISSLLEPDSVAVARVVNARRVVAVLSWKGRECEREVSAGTRMMKIAVRLAMRER